MPADSADAAQRAVAAFRARHGHAPEVCWGAPGRVNLIGEHTDYNDGFVLPFALPHRTVVAASARDDGLLNLTTVGADGRPQIAEPLHIAELEPGHVTGWAAYPAGVAWVLREEGVRLGGADLVICGDVPTGAGLSSSAALECATALSLLDLAGTPLDGPADDARPDLTRIARWAQRAENDFVGAPTGVLDQTASLCCTAAHVLFLDVRSGEQIQVPFDTAAHGLRLLVIDTRTRHAHSESGYGERRRGCVAAAEALEIESLREVAHSGLDVATARLPEELRPLVRHVVTENARVESVVTMLTEGRLDMIGPLLTASHESLRDDYRVSSPELDLVVESALAAGALGARMTGGGFGGSAIALIRSAAQAEVEESIIAAFDERGLAHPRFFAALPSAGAGREESSAG
ncbi:galactokinase [Actinoalloteichus sp. GBA129-24]|uniref:Galactokinase n=1 Tax=Actinoalloteichus fjordicus TaxID=1612552 RepID=A0AAC9LCB3_9PSEU|nr:MULTISPECIES: galactokinase [Actinoalloteichus]APU13810.1 galactokinase [Actinoalloteichus fjordicus]APU19756.1 galactokinase [Actinoalloteichus sp. GBA129-24]